MQVLIFLVCLFASMVGGICGIGGGVIIKPTLDAMGIMSVSTISFLSGLTVLSMSLISVFRQRKNRLVEMRIGSFLAAGAVVGGMIGNALFQAVKSAAGQDDFVGMIQAAVLALVTFLTLLYSVFLRRRLPSYRVTNSAACIGVGGIMGILSSFLGIGGGPINLAVLYFIFSMDTKKAAANSLYIIMFSQIASFCTSCVRGTIPEFSWGYLIVMVTAGVLGGLLGTRVNKKLSAAVVDKLFAGLMCVIILICIYNACRFAALI
ncbi:sulfite exporter TauE/SafE family protein [uncultured Dysosmobacter sp.]|uniref:sulfite exporter TauE/SafE family protein n=1 Tax=uncultured Dysosmobacter sp. TaxID=2591384 RepID=UPI00262973CA|nr:sulfite exporter TauE/SafE family protein [uncultured Dysosmobacter sp.]